jgi:hypothetical protein
VPLAKIKMVRGVLSSMPSKWRRFAGGRTRGVHSLIWLLCVRARGGRRDRQSQICMCVCVYTHTQREREREREERQCVRVFVRVCCISFRDVFCRGPVRSLNRCFLPNCRIGESLRAKQTLNPRYLARTGCLHSLPHAHHCCFAFDCTAT